MSTNSDSHSIRELAYQLWVERGQPEGDAELDWYEAERRLLGSRKTDSQVVDEAIKESFPASDPPASGLPDKPPANAEEKWRAVDEAADPGQQSPNISPAAPGTALPPVKPTRRGAAAKAGAANSKPRETTKLGSRDAPGG